MERAFSPGFRLSAFDCVVLIVGAVLTVAVSAIRLPIGFAVGFVVLHFFVFCNIVRMSRKLELIWTALFIILAAGAVAQLISWTFVFGLSLAGSTFLAIMEMRGISYHGVGWRRINPSGRRNRIEC